MKIAVLVSGGVDSSVALKLLKDQGHDVTAFYLKIWLEDELAYLGSCPWQEDLSYVEAVCQQLNVPLQVVSLQDAYWGQVVRYALDEIKAGRTPNPDIMCNTRVKFGAFLDAIDDSYEKVATGHYAQVREVDGVFELFASPDQVKDQTYFLSHISQYQLSRALFPIGHLDKPELRKLAQAFDLPTKDRKDSQGICFLGKLKFSEFLKANVGEKIGDLIEFETGNIVGQHKGFWFYTIGQRQGIGLAGGPWYVVKKDVTANRVYISKNYHTDDKQRDTFYVAEFHWLGKQATNFDGLTVKLRHGPQRHGCTITPVTSGGYMVKLHEDDQGIAAGQFAVFYDGDRCIASGVMQEV